MMRNNMTGFADVAFYKINRIEYPQMPYQPEECYAELGDLPYKIEIQDSNEIYTAVRDVLRRLGLDWEHQNTTAWNPLHDYVREGGKVFIKPNQVFHEHKEGVTGIWSMVTHASVIRPLIDYILLATKGDVEIIIGEAPVQGADFQEAVKKSGLADLIKFYRQKNVSIQLIDLRMIIAQRTETGIVSKKTEKIGRASCRERV